MESILLNNLPGAEAEFVENILLGNSIRNLQLPLEDSLALTAQSLDIELKCYSLANCEESDTLRHQNTNKRVVRIGICQMMLPKPTTATISDQKSATVEFGLKILALAHSTGVKIFCFQELWTMPFAFCTGAKLPWVEFAEDAIEGSTTQTLQTVAKQYQMVIVSPILERDENDVLWNTAVVIDATGEMLGKYRKCHIPIAGNENIYFQNPNTGIPVFKTKYGTIGVNICFDRHHPLHWYTLKLGKAQIVFNPCASVQSFSQHLWPIEARNAAISNGYFVAAINRVGTETFYNYDGSTNKTRTYYGSSYVTAPNGVRTPGLSSGRSRELLIATISYLEHLEYLEYI